MQGQGENNQIAKMKQIVVPPTLFPAAGDFNQIKNRLICVGNYHSFAIDKKFSGNRILFPGPNKLYEFTIPLQRETFKACILSELCVLQDNKWLRELKHAMKSTYGKSPFYEFYDYKIWKIFDERASDSYIELLKSLFRFYAKSLEWDFNVTELHPDSFEILKEEKRTVTKSYPQAFDTKIGFVPNAPIIDLIFNLGPNSGMYFES
jgi:hypothetical protein